MATHASKWWVLLSMCLITAMFAIEGSALNIGIPAIAHDLHISLSNMQWVINSFFLIAAMVEIVGGHLGDNYGHKKIFLLSVILFVLSSLGAGISRSEEALIGYRALQGLSVGIAGPLTIVLISEAFPLEMQSYARSFAVSTMGISLAVGAPLGGWLVHTVGWRWIFFINVPIGLLSFLLAFFHARPLKIRDTQPIDWKGLIILICALCCFSLALNEMQNWGFYSLIPLSVAILIVWFLYGKEKNQKEPIVNFPLFKNRIFLINAILRIITQIVFLALLFFLPLYLQNIAGFSALKTGLIFLALTLAMCLFSPVAGRWVDRQGGKKTEIFSLILMLIASSLFLFLKEIPDLVILTSALLLFGIAITTLLVSTTSGALHSSPTKNKGVRMGLFYTLMWFGCALGISLSGTLIASASNRYLKKELAGSTLNPYQLEQLKRTSHGLVPLKRQEILPYTQLAQKAFMKGMRANIYLFLTLSAAGLILAINLKPKEE